MNSISRVFQAWRFFYLLAALLALLVIQPVVSALGISGWLFDVLFVVVMGVLFLALAQDRVWRIVALVLCLPAATLALGGHVLASTSQDVTLNAGRTMGALFFVMATGAIVRTVSASREISLDSVFGAICGYLLLGVAWGLAYESIYAANPASFHFAAPIRPFLEQVDYSRSLFMYYSFVTLTTAGYGDVTPLTVPAQTLAWIEAVLGQLYLAVLIAGLMSALVAKQMARVRDQRG